MALCEDGQNRGSWSVAATVKEPAVLLQAFVAHHVDLGADKVTLYLDAPDDELTDLLSHIDGCEIIQCDKAYWSSVQRKSAHKSHIRRQLDNLAHAYETCGSEWLLHLDADEFVLPGNCGPVSTMLAALPDTLDCAKMRNVERIYADHQMGRSIFDGVFRQPFFAFWSDTEDLVEPAARPFLYRGVTGYAQGKSFTRTGRNLLPGIHSARGIKGHASHWVIPGAEVLHFDGLTPLHWASKLMRFAEFPGHLSEKNFGAARLEQIRHVQNQTNAGARIHELHQLLKVQSPAQLARLNSLGLLRQPEFDPMMALARHGLSPDLSTASFDADLIRQMPQHADLVENWIAMDLAAQGRAA